jgi:hypothetical protein
MCLLRSASGFGVLGGGTKECGAATEPVWHDAAMSTLEQRVADLERLLREQVGLRAAQDRDLGSIEQAQRAMSLSLQALAITQSEHNRKIDDLAAVVAGHTNDLAEIKSGIAAITGLLTTLINSRPDGA